MVNYFKKELLKLFNSKKSIPAVLSFFLFMDKNFFYLIITYTDTFETFSDILQDHFDHCSNIARHGWHRRHCWWTRGCHKWLQSARAWSKGCSRGRNWRQTTVSGSSRYLLYFFIVELFSNPQVKVIYNLIFFNFFCKLNFFDWLIHHASNWMTDFDR